MKTILWLVIIPALLPVVILFWYIYAKDKVEKDADVDNIMSEVASRMKKYQATRNALG